MEGGRRKFHGRHFGASVEKLKVLVRHREEPSGGAAVVATSRRRFRQKERKERKKKSVRREKREERTERFHQCAASACDEEY